MQTSLIKRGFSSVKQIHHGWMICALLLLSINVKAEIAVIVHPSVTATNVDAQTIADIFLGKTNNLPDGTRLTAVDQDDKSAIYVEFADKLLNKTPSQLNAFWSRLVFTGKGAPPQQLASDGDVVNLVAQKQEAIGYVKASAVTSKVKILHTLP